MIRPLITAPNTLLKKPSENVDVIDDEIKKLVEDMFLTMQVSYGIGLSAVQVGVLKKVITVNITDIHLNKTKLCLINAEVINRSEELQPYTEGCLSYPGIGIDIERPKEIVVHYKDLSGLEVEQTFDGLLATCIQHEIDHTNGITFINYVSKLKQDIILRKIKKLRK
jgi:peptide deformylase